MRLIVAGSRDFKDYELLEREVLKFIKKHKEVDESVEVISGRARGADKLGEVFADKFGLKKHIKPADWDKHGRAAGFIRNREMVSEATHCICFWDRKSSGTKNTIQLSEEKGIPLCVIEF
mgnify:CR=1 FL=1